MYKIPPAFPAVSVLLLFRQNCVNPNRKAVTCAFCPCRCLSDGFFFPVNESSCHIFLVWISESLLPRGGALWDII